MIRSMTAYAKAFHSTEDLQAEFEIRTYNNRHLDISLRVPHGYQPLEEKIKAVISDKLARGRVEIKLTLQKKTEESHRYEVDLEKALGLKKALQELKTTLDYKGDLPFDTFLSASSGIIKPAEVTSDLDSEWCTIEKALISAMDELLDMREREGAFLLKDFTDRMNYIETVIDQVEAGSKDLILLYRNRLTERIKALTDGNIELDEARITQEAAYLADKSDISEEIVRSRSHIVQFRDIMKAKEPGGRKLNFLLQEFNREFNTIGSKIGNADIAHSVVDVKAELEKLREQIQNIE